MKIKVIVVLLPLLFVVFACHKDDSEPVFTTEGYIIGFDPCTIRHPGYDLGLAIVSTDVQDTLVTYNFPDSIYNFPDEYFQNYMSSAYFPDSARYEYKIKIEYKKAENDEVVILECLADFNQADFSKQIMYNQVIIEKIINY